MNRKHSGVAVLSLVGTTALAAGLVAYTPITCGCTAPWESIGLSVSGERPKSAEVLTLGYIRDNLFAKFTGKPVVVRDLPTANGPSDCAASSLPVVSIRCRWWIWRAPGRLKGFDVTVRTDVDGIFSGIDVAEIEHVDGTAAQ